MVGLGSALLDDPSVALVNTERILTIFSWSGRARYVLAAEEFLKPGTAQNSSQFSSHTTRKAKVGVPGLTFQSLRRSFATLIHGKGTPKDAQTQMRHRDILMTLNVYTQPIPESVKNSVEALDAELLKILDEIGRASEGSVQ